MNDFKETKCVIGTVRFSYVHVWEPASIGDDANAKKKYSVSLIIPKNDTKSVNAVKAAIQNALNAGIGKFGGKIPAVWKIRYVTVIPKDRMMKLIRDATLLMPPVRVNRVWSIFNDSLLWNRMNSTAVVMGMRLLTSLRSILTVTKVSLADLTIS